MRARITRPVQGAGATLGTAHIPRLKISHRLFAARCVAAIIDRGRLLPRCYRPKPRLVFVCLRVAHDAANDWSAFVTEPHIIVVLVPKIRSSAFACRYKNKLCVTDLRMYHRMAQILAVTGKAPRVFLILLQE